MHLTSFSNWLGQVTQPEHPYYHPVQLTLSAGISYISTACLTRTPPIRGMTFVTLAYAVSQLVTPLFVQLFEPYREIALVPLIGQITQLSISCLFAKVICNFIGQPLSFKEVRQVGTACLITLFVAQFAFNQFRKQFKRSNS